MAYLDHAATTPMLPEAISAVAAAMGQVGNPSSLHTSGRTARRRVEESRETLAAALGARPSEIVFTAGGTESDNLAVKGTYWARRAADPARRRVLVSAIEHHAVLDAADWLTTHDDAEVELLPVNAHGIITPAVLREAIERDPRSVALVSVMWANNEIGTVQDMRALCAVAAEYDVPMHSDAVQAVGAVPVDFATSGLAALTMTGHKLGGPSAAGALLLRRDHACVPLQHGGGQERDVRSGTLDVPGVVGLATATDIAVRRRESTAHRVSTLRARLWNGIRDTIAGAHESADPIDRLPGVLNVCFDGCEGDALLMLLDAQGIEVSTGSACSAGVAQASHVLMALGLSAAQAKGAVRFSLGHTSTDADVDAVLAALPPAVERARRAALPTAHHGVHRDDNAMPITR